MNPHGMTDEEFEWWRHETLGGALWELSQEWKKTKQAIYDALPTWIKHGLDK